MIRPKPLCPGCDDACPARGVARFCALQRSRVARAEMAATRALWRRINACPHRGCKVGCGTATCAKGKGMGGVVGAMDCEICQYLPADPEAG